MVACGRWRIGERSERGARVPDQRESVGARHAKADDPEIATEGKLMIRPRRLSARAGDQGPAGGSCIDSDSAIRFLPSVELQISSCGRLRTAPNEVALTSHGSIDTQPANAS